MNITLSLSNKKPDVGALSARKDFRGLIGALYHRDATVQWQAAEALGKLGPEASDHLLAALRTRHREARLGVIEALGEIQDVRTVPNLIELLKDPSVEVRWATAIALGEIGDRRAVEALIPVLGDPDKYVRYGAAIGLERLGWQPSSDTEKAYFHLGKQEWEHLSGMGEAALRPLRQALKDRHADVRVKAMEVVGTIGSPRGISAVMQGLRDEHPGVRWKAVLAGPCCGIHRMYLPRGLNKRPRVRKSPRVAAFLNFILPGQGYNYLGLWVGTLIFQLDVSITLFMLTFYGDTAFGIMFPLYFLFAIHGWYIARKMPEL